MVRNWCSLLRVMSNDIKFAVVVVVQWQASFLLWFSCYFISYLIIQSWHSLATCAHCLNIASISPRCCHKQWGPSELSVAERVSVSGNCDKFVTNCYSIVTRGSVGCSSCEMSKSVKTAAQLWAPLVQNIVRCFQFLRHGMGTIIGKWYFHQWPWPSNDEIRRSLVLWHVSLHVPLVRRVVLRIY